MAKMIKVESTFKGFNIAGSGVATIRFRASFTEITNYLNLIGLQDEDLILAVKDDPEGAFKKIGNMRLKQINFKGEDGADFVFKGESVTIPTCNSFLDKVVTFAVKKLKEDA